MSKIPVAIRTRSRSATMRARSVGTQTVGLNGDSNYDTLNKSRTVSKSAPFSSTPTTSTGRNLRRKSPNTTSRSNNSSVEIPKELMPNVTEIGKSNLHGKSSMSNVTENNSKTRSQVNTRFMSKNDQNSQDEQHLSSGSKQRGKKMARFYIDDNEDENDSDDMMQPNPSENMASQESGLDKSKSPKEAILSRRKNLSMSAGRKTKKSEPALKIPRTRSLNRTNDLITDDEDDLMDVQPTTSQAAAEVSKTKAKSASKGKRGKSSIVISKLNKIPQASQQHELHDDIDNFHHLDLDQQNTSPDSIHDETYLIHANNLNNNSLYSDDHNSIQHQDSGLVRLKADRRKAIRKVASKQAQRRLGDIKQLVDEYGAEIRSLSQFNQSTSNVRRSSRLRMKRLTRLTNARNDLIDQLRRDEEAREEYQHVNIAKKSKKSQPIKINSQFVTLRPNNEGFSAQQTRANVQRKSKKGNLLRMIED